MNPDSTLSLETTPSEACPICGGTGYVRLNVPVGDPRFGKAVPCVCTRANLRERRLSELRKASNLQHLQKMTFETFQTSGPEAPEVAMALKEALRVANDYAQAPSGWLVLSGPYGCGKTHLAAAIANCRIQQGLPALFVVTPDLLDYLRAAYAPNSPATYDQRFEEIRNIEFLVLDDLGTQNTTPWAAEKLYQLLNHRYNACLPTVITTNQLLEEMDPRLASRLKDQDLVHHIPVYAPDYRTKVTGEMFGSLNHYEDMTFNTFSARTGELDRDQTSSLRGAVQLAQNYADAPINWLLLRGGYGVGKTHLAAAIANKVVRSGQLVLFVVVPDLLDHLRATFQPGSGVSYDQRFNEVRRAKLLVLDDMGTQSATPWAQEKLFQILNYRYTAALPTVITISNEAWDRLDDRLRSRFLHTRVCTIADLCVPTFQGQAAKPRQPARTTRRRT
ncbi:MAG: ATP-binding protein [Anaerolineae bacterium]